MSEKGNYILAVIQARESYDTLAESLADIITEMQDLQKISVDDKTFDIYLSYQRIIKIRRTRLVLLFS
jgi:hypothetical protein